MRTVSILALAACVTAASAVDPINVAASANGGVASQSSTGFGGTANRANDGDRNGSYSADSVSHTANEFQPWWQSLFAEPATIAQVLLFNRTDFGPDRINTFSLTLYLGNDIVWSSNGNTFVVDIVDTNVSGMTFNTGSVMADRVRIRLDGFNFLHIAELEAWTIPTPAATSLLGIAGFAALRRRR